MALLATTASSSSFPYSSCVYEWPSLTNHHTSTGSKNINSQRSDIHNRKLRVQSYKDDGSGVQEITWTAAEDDTGNQISENEKQTDGENAIDKVSGRFAPEADDDIVIIGPSSSSDLDIDVITHDNSETVDSHGESDLNNTVEVTSQTNHCDIPIEADVKPKDYESFKTRCNNTDAVQQFPKDAQNVTAQTTCTADDSDIIHRGNLAENDIVYRKDLGENMHKKKNKTKKVRVKSKKKWKNLELPDLGFHISLLPPHPCESVSSDESKDINEVPCSGDEICQPQSTPETDNSFDHDIDGVAERRANENTVNDIDDDVTFFRELGIDVLGAEYNDIFDEFMDWDGVSFPHEDQRYVARNISKGQSRVLKTPNFNRKTSGKTSQTPSSPTQETSLKDQESSTIKRSLAKNKVAESLSWYLPSAPSPKIKKCDRYKLFELEANSSKKIYIRRDRHRRVQKAHIAVKSKNCVSIFNNRGRKNLYMHHRLVKMHNLCLDFRQTARSGPVPRMPKKNIDPTVAKSAIQADRNTSVSHRAGDRPAPKQNLKHALHETNAPGHLEQDLASFLISLQHRELTPEDYDMLLRLDDSVKPKTVPKHVLDTLKTEKIGPEGVGLAADGSGVMCTICMEPYTAGQERKFLPCDHDFHTACIDMWLKNSSMNCPLDGLPLEPS